MPDIPILTDDELALLEANVRLGVPMPEITKRLLATIRAQRAGLEFYADPANHRHTHDWHGQMIVEPSAVDEDGGKRARAILHPKREEATRA